MWRKKTIVRDDIENNPKKCNGAWCMEMIDNIVFKKDHIKKGLEEEEDDVDNFLNKNKRSLYHAKKHFF
jgi:hypothetical protein